MVKRQNEVQLTKDNYDQDQDQDQQPSDDEETDHGVAFARASEQVLAQRKIYRARRPTETTSISTSNASSNNNNNNPFASIALTAPSVSTSISTAAAPTEENTETAETAPVVAAETTTTTTATESTSPKLFGAAATFVTGFGAATGTGFGSASSSSSAFGGGSSGSGGFTGTGFFANTTTGVFGEAAAGSATATSPTTSSTATGTTTTITTSSSNGNSAPNHGLAEAPAAATLFPEHYQREPDEEGETCVLVIKCKSWRRGVVPPATTDNDETTAAATISHPSVPPSTLSATATSSNPEPPPLSNETSTSTSTTATAEGEATATMPISDEQKPTSNTTGNSTEPQEEWLELCKGGDLRVLRHNETLQPRLLHRVEETRRVCLNTVLSEICQVTQPSEKHVQIHNLEVHASKNLRLHLFKCRSVAEATSLKECIELGIRNYRTACLERRQQPTSTAKEEVVDTIHDEPKTNDNEE